MPSSESFNFYPRPPRGERRGRPSGRTLKKPFLSTPSARRATCGALRRGLAAALFLSTPSARRATLGANGKPRPWKISIHALREEGDQGRAGFFVIVGISIHALREEGDADTFDLSNPAFISIHALREEGDHRSGRGRGQRPISIHALREEGDGRLYVVMDEHRQFLSTPSARRATASRFWL